MQISSAKVKNFFNQAAETYDLFCTLQNKICKQLIDYLQHYPIMTSIIADFGCGTGVSTQLLVERFTFERLYAVDFAERLLDKAKQKLTSANIQFLLKDFDCVDLAESSIDLVFSNMALQWSGNLAQTLLNTQRYLGVNGLLAFTLPLQHTFAELNASYKNSFYSLDAVVSLMEKLGFVILMAKQQCYVENFPSSLEALRSIKRIGANCLFERKSKPGLSGLNALFNVSDAASNKKLTYNIGYFIAHI